MKKYIIKIALVAMTMAAPITASAQGLLDGLKQVVTGVTGSEDTTNALTNIVGNLLGTSTVKESSLVGTWSYTQPCVAFESKDMLSQLGGGVASSKVQSKLKKGLEKVGFKKGKVTLTFKSDNTFTIKMGKTTRTGTYSVSGSDLQLKFNYTNRTVNMNVKLALGQLQIAMKADKMLQFVSAIATKVSAYSSQMALVSTLLGQYSGMYLGLEFSK